ncbi:MAG: nucleotidyltransferase domain-containing protein [Bacteroidota bacterium]|nr:nucleotidyltransferase domain-containing protein [Bacteroidota bacterium]
MKDHKSEFKEKYNIHTLGIFGSFANDNAHENSDIDLIVDFDASTSDIFEKKREIKHILRNKFNREIDICNIKYIKPYLKDLILKQAIYV